MDARPPTHTTVDICSGCGSDKSSTHPETITDTTDEATMEAANPNLKEATRSAASADSVGNAGEGNMGDGGEGMHNQGNSRKSKGDATYKEGEEQDS